MSFASRLFRAVACLALLGGCRAGGCAANVLGDVVGTTGDAHCDRRFVSGAEKKRAGFCQEIIDTVALSQFQDDCREKHTANTGEGRCPREHVLGGCKLHEVNDDGSEVWDWYYDVTELEADGGVFEAPVRTKDEVRTLCADRERYEKGASFQEP
jgi:hypothetical protein